MKIVINLTYLSYLATLKKNYRIWNILKPTSRDHFFFGGGGGGLFAPTISMDNLHNRINLDLGRSFTTARTSILGAVYMSPLCRASPASRAYSRPSPAY